MAAVDPENNQGQKSKVHQLIDDIFEKDLGRHT